MDSDHLGPLTGARPGERWVIRRRLPDGSATDVIGWINQLSDLAVESQPSATAPALWIGTDSVIAARRVPAAAGGPDPMRTSAEDLEQIALPGWLAEHESLGEWTLRSAGGFTGRANSGLAVGDPGVDYPAAARRVCAYAAAHGIEPRAQVINGSAQDHALRDLGWVPTYVDTEVLVTRLSRLLGETAPDPRVEIAEELTDRWLTGYHCSRPNDVDPRLLRMILAGQPPHAFAGVADEPDDQLFGIGRGHVHRGWLGLASIWTRPERRRQGWGRAIVLALGHWGARHGARSVYLQVAAENGPALSAYEALGFRRHHRYGYLTPG